MSDSRVTAVDRLGFSLFFAAAVHAIFVLGVGFKEDKPPKIAHTLEVTLAQFESEKAPEKADFIAQQNQQGSGESNKKALPTTTQRSPFQANQAKPLAAKQQASSISEVEPLPTAPSKQVTKKPVVAELKAAPEPKQQKPVVLTESTNAKRSADRELKKQSQTSASKPTIGFATSLLAQSLEIASLEAKLDLHRQQTANQPRVRRLYSASTRESYDAAYLDGWRRKVERVGNLHYPQEAHRRGLYGHLRLLVVIEPDGALQRVEVLKSSGYSLLDDAAKRIVHLAAPFAPFPVELRKRADLVEIIRTWRFEKSRFGIKG